MREIGILFKQDMVRAILEGRKNQTRQIIKPQPDDSGLHNHSKFPMSLDDTLQGWWGTVEETGESKEFKCRYGQKGDLLYVKETWTEWPKGEFQYKASTANGEELGKWKSPLFLRKEDARIWLRNTGVRVERLQDISEKDAIWEGIKCHKPVPGDGLPIYKNYQYGKDQYWGGIQNIGKLKSFFNPDYSFRSLIQSIHGDQIWEENPWVFRISFELLSTTGRPKNI